MHKHHKISVRLKKQRGGSKADSDNIPQSITDPIAQIPKSKQLHKPKMPQFFRFIVGKQHNNLRLNFLHFQNNIEIETGLKYDVAIYIPM